MAVESSDDRADFLNTSDFGLAGTYTPNGGSASTVNGFFDKPSSSIPLDTGEVDVDSNTPTFLCETSDVSSAASGDTLTVSSVGYTVIGVQEDGQGMTNLVLELT
jgi:hypothetical protein